MIALDDVRAAAQRLKGVIAETPFAYGPFLSAQSGVEVFLKKENLQNTGSFKIRGAFNRIAMLEGADRQKGVIAASAGNHAQGVAFSAAHFGVKSYIVMPEATPLLKVNGAKNLGANVILHGANYDEAYAYALEYAKAHDLTFIHPFADHGVIAGQGTLALEMLESVPDLDALVVPVGGGGLISGVAVAAKAINPRIRIIGVTASGAPAMRNSWLSKQAQDSLSVRTIADGIAVRDTSPLTLAYLLACVDDVVEVDDEEIANAILFLIEKQKLVVEGAGAVGVAALMHDRLKLPKGSKVGLLLSGGNIDVTMLAVIIEKGLIKSSRKMKLIVTLIDKPGSLQKLSSVLTDVSANIVHIDFDRTARSLDYGDAYVSVSLETKGLEHQEQIRARLKAAGFVFQEI
ncbi:MAG: threonine ammonia-lyase [Campylobacterales bacterium]